MNNKFQIGDLVFYMDTMFNPPLFDGYAIILDYERQTRSDTDQLIYTVLFFDDQKDVSVNLINEEYIIEVIS